MGARLTLSRLIAAARRRRRSPSLSPRPRRRPARRPPRAGPRPRSRSTISCERSRTSASISRDRLRRPRGDRALSSAPRQPVRRAHPGEPSRAGFPAPANLASPSTRAVRGDGCGAQHLGQRPRSAPSPRRGEASLLSAMETTGISLPRVPGSELLICGVVSLVLVSGLPGYAALVLAVGARGDQPSAERVQERPGARPRGCAAFSRAHLGHGAGPSASSSGRRPVVSAAARAPAGQRAAGQRPSRRAVPRACRQGKRADSRGRFPSGASRSSRPSSARRSRLAGEARRPHLRARQRAASIPSVGDDAFPRARAAHAPGQGVSGEVSRPRSAADVFFVHSSTSCGARRAELAQLVPFAWRGPPPRRCARAPRPRRPCAVPAASARRPHRHARRAPHRRALHATAPVRAREASGRSSSGARHGVRSAVAAPRPAAVAVITTFASTRPLSPRVVESTASPVDECRTHRRDRAREGCGRRPPAAGARRRLQRHVLAGDRGAARPRLPGATSPVSRCGSPSASSRRTPLSARPLSRWISTVLPSGRPS